MFLLLSNSKPKLLLFSEASQEYLSIWVGTLGAFMFYLVCNSQNNIYCLITGRVFLKLFIYYLPGM